VNGANERRCLSRSRMQEMRRTSMCAPMRKGRTSMCGIVCPHAKGTHINVWHCVPPCDMLASYLLPLVMQYPPLGLGRAHQLQLLMLSTQE
jgi:hypothetical protein